MEKRKSYLLIALVITLILILITGTYFYERFESDKIKKEKYSELSGIAKMKETQIENWVEDQKKNCEMITMNPLYVDAVSKLLARNIPQDLKSKVADLNLLLLQQNHFEDILLVTTNARIITAFREEDKNVEYFAKQFLLKAVESNQTIVSSLYFCETHHKIHLDILSPVIKDGRTIATLAGRIDPYEFLFPLVQSWPIQSKSAETLLIERDKDSVVFLNKLRHIKNDPLKMRFLLKNKNLPAARAVLGETGIFEGLDYRGVKVLSDLRPVRNTNWFMVAKVDQEEIYSELFYRTVLIYSVLFLFSSIFVIIAFAYYRSNQKEHFEKLFHMERELRKKHEEFRTTLYSIGDGVICTDVEGKIKQMNHIAEKLTGWKEKDVLGKAVETVFNIISEYSRVKVASPVKKVLEEGVIVGLANHTLLVSKDGLETPIADSGAPIRSENGEVQGVVLVFRDQTEERNAQREVEQSAGKFLSLFNNMNEGVALHSLVCDEAGNPVNYKIVDVNPAFERILNLDGKNVVGKLATEIYEVAEPPFLEEYSEVAINKKSFIMKNYFPPMKKHFEISVTPWSLNGFATIFTDVTDRINIEEAVQKRINALTQPAGSEENITISELFEIKDIQKIQDSFSNATGVASIITDLNGTPVTEPSNFCNLCINIIRKTERGSFNCFKSDATLGNHHPGGPIIQPCLSGGLWDAGASITVGGKHIGNWLIGQVRDENIDEEKFLKYADEIGADRNEFRKALLEVPVMTREKFAEIADSLFIFANELSLKAYQNIQQARFISERKKIEDELQQSYDMLSKLTAQVPGVVYQYRLYKDGHSAFPFSSPGMVDIYEVTSEEVREDATPVFGRLHPDDLDNIIFTIQESARTQQLYHSEFRVILPQQGLRWRLCDATPELLEDGSTLWYGIISDITERKNIEEALRLREEKLSVTLNSIGDGVISTDTNGIITQLNPVAESLTGWRNIDAVGKPLEVVFNIINAETRITADNPVWRVIEEGIIVGMANHTTLISKDGFERQIADSAAPIKTKNGEIIGVVLVFSDVTVQYEVQSQLVQNERLLRESQQVGNIGSYTLDIPLGLWISSKALDEIFGIDESYIKSVEGWIGIIHHGWQQDMSNYFMNDVLGKGIPFDKEYKIVRKNDGAERWVHGYGELELDENKNPVRMIGTIQDVTDITNARIELELYKNQLEEIVKQRTAQLDSVNARLVEEIQKQKEYELLLQDTLLNEKEMNDLKTRFISTVSHEFRTPLMSIQLSADLLHRYSKNFTDDKFSNQINSIRNSIVNLTKLLDDVLTINRADAGKIICEPAKLNLYDEIEKIIEEENVFKKDEHLMVLNYMPDKKEFMLDIKLIRYILMNLLSNAYKYSPSGGKVEINISLNHRTLQLMVIDSGIGFGEDVSEKLFEPFFRTKNAMDIPGSGLGLSIVKKAVDLHRGEITYSSTPGKGTTFIVKIPV